MAIYQKQRAVLAAAWKLVNNPCVAQSDLSDLTTIMWDFKRFMEQTNELSPAIKAEYLRDVFGGSNESSPAPKAIEKGLEADCIHSGREYCRKYGQICHHTKENICQSYERKETCNSQANQSASSSPVELSTEPKSSHLEDFASKMLDAGVRTITITIR
jgi:hypothetical protein